MLFGCILRYKKDGMYAVALHRNKKDGI